VNTHPPHACPGWLRLDHDGDVLQAAITFVSRAIEAEEGDIQAAIQATNFLFPNNIDDIPQFDLTEFGAAWLGGWNSADAPRAVEELSQMGEFDDTMLLLVRYIFNAYPQGLLVFGSKLNHACDPNVTVTLEPWATDSDRFSVRFTASRSRKYPLKSCPVCGILVSSDLRQ